MVKPKRSRMTSTVYIAGPIRGRPNLGFPEHLEAVRRLRAGGYNVLSPAERDLQRGWVVPAGPPAGRFDFADSKEDFPLAEAMLWNVAAIERSDIVALLPGWEDSQGCRIEVEHAKRHNKPVKALEVLLHETHLARIRAERGALSYHTICYVFALLAFMAVGVAATAAFGPASPPGLETVQADCFEVVAEAQEWDSQRDRRHYASVGMNGVLAGKRTPESQRACYVGEALALAAAGEFRARP